MECVTLCVAMCTYRGERFLPEQLESIAAQTRPPDRLVVVDDASTDDTAEVVRRFARRADFPVELHVNARNLGCLRNFERAVRFADGDVVVLADQDDVWTPSRLARLEEAFAGAPGVGLAFSDAEVVDAALRPLGYGLWESVGLRGRTREEVCAGRLFEALVRTNVVTGATLAFRADLRPLLLPFPPAVDHDSWIALVTAAVAEAVAIPERLVRYRQHGGNQIGAGRPGLRARLERARTERDAGLRARRLRNATALERLSDAPGVDPARLRLLEESVAHLDARARLAAARPPRLRLVAAELAAGRYARCSAGWLSALRDLVV